jgi:carboxyl-terminal processing protease
VYTYKRKVQCLDLPLAVLTDGGSASASEIIVGCLKDSSRAAVLGERTYGKGLAQGVSTCIHISRVLVFV